MKRHSRSGRKDALDQLARRLELDPCNRDGADKSWVLKALRNAEKLMASARLLPGRTRGSVR